MDLLIFNIDYTASEGPTLPDGTKLKLTRYLDKWATKKQHQLTVDTLGWIYTEETITPEFNLGELNVSTFNILNNHTYLRREQSNFWNTHVDVYFSFLGMEYKKTFADWAFWRTLSDEQCAAKLINHIKNKDLL